MRSLPFPQSSAKTSEGGEIRFIRYRYSSEANRARPKMNPITLRENNETKIVILILHSLDTYGVQFPETQLCMLET